MNRPAHRNVTWDELTVGQTARTERTVTENDLYIFAHSSGNTNPMHLPAHATDSGNPTDPVAPSMWVGSLISSVLGTLLPGAGTLYRRQAFQFVGRARLGDHLLVTVRCIEKLEKPCALFETQVKTSTGQLLLEGVAEVQVPTMSIIQPATELPLLMLDEHDHFGTLLQRCRQLPPMPTAVVCPDDRNSLGGALASARERLIIPILIGDKAAITAAAAELDEKLDGFTIIDIHDHDEAAAHAVALTNSGQVRAIMKGNIHSDELLAHVVKKEGGLRSSRRISHVFAMDCPTLPNMLFISDAVINIAPDLTTKIAIVQNAIDLAQACGVAKPKIGILAATETVNVNMPSTLDAAILSKMADRGQITGGIVDGPLAMDNAIDIEAARTKGIASSVAGQADVLIVPNLEAGNMLAKELTFVARADAAGLVVGAKVPIMLTSRADNDKARLASCALAQLYDHWRRTGSALSDAQAIKAAE